MIKGYFVNEKGEAINIEVDRIGELAPALEEAAERLKSNCNEAYLNDKMNKVQAASMYGKMSHINPYSGTPAAKKSNMVECPFDETDPSINPCGFPTKCRPVPDVKLTKVTKKEYASMVSEEEKVGKEEIIKDLEETYDRLESLRKEIADKLLVLYRETGRL